MRNALAIVWPSAKYISITVHTYRSGCNSMYIGLLRALDALNEWLFEDGGLSWMNSPIDVFADGGKEDPSGLGFCAVGKIPDLNIDEPEEG